MTEHERFMREALAEAEAASEAGQLPIDAVVVFDGEVVSRGQNRHLERRTQLAHAELEALLEGGDAVWSRHDDCVLYTTVEPCPMCLGAMVMADVPNVVFAAHDANAGIHHMGDNAYVARHIRSYEGGILERESLDLIARYDPELLAFIMGSA
ncbi:MAG TPA: nucleoside deaminase [Gaiellaceae bacterium]|nr:nucleoside deaminase [Gaiellaceae bacterium]